MCSRSITRTKRRASADVAHRAAAGGGGGRRGRFAAADEADRLNAPWPSVHGEREVGGLERGDWNAVAAEHGHVHEDEVDARFETALAAGGACPGGGA